MSRAGGTALVYSLAAALTLTACGKRGALVYPELLAPAAAEKITLQQTGDSMRLVFSLPGRDLAGRRLSGLKGVTVRRRVDPGTQAAACRVCTDDYLLFREISLDPLPRDVTRRGSELILMDHDIVPGQRYSYRISVHSADGGDGSGSIPVSATAVTPLPPPLLKASGHPTEVLLEFAGSGIRSGYPAGYHVYRAKKGAPLPALPLTRVPVAGGSFADNTPERGIVYRYAVTEVVRLESGGYVESTASAEAEAALKDELE